MVRNYRRIEKLPAGGAEQAEQFRQEVFEWIARAMPDEEFQQELRRRLAERFGAEGSYGVFVRSDTNVEDLPDFTGAGLNLTVPNVVGFGNILRAIPQVWASPFSARAFAWRQSRMAAPEHVYPAVLLLKASDVEKSGVLVTADLDTGDAGWLSVAVNEGVGGAVDNQSAEALRINVRTGEVRLMGQASAPFRRRLDPAGGVKAIPASGADVVLADAEIGQLRAFSGTLAREFPPIVDASGRVAPADVEFGFAGGSLELFQVRPFLENPAAAGSAYLRSLDPDAERTRGMIVDLGGIPE
jgi:phosphoenolpyruvate synthase/pyruvate phosphate dikinase